MPPLDHDRDLAATTITAVLIVRDEAVRLRTCLASLRGAVDAILVLDTGSEDGTVDLLATLAADPTQDPPLRWATRPFDDFSRSRTAALAHVTTPYWLWIDADERLSPALNAEIATRRRDGSLDDHAAWTVSRENRVRGRVMTMRSLRGQRLVRLARVEAAALSGDTVHEGLVPRDLDDAIGALAAPLMHEALTDTRSYLHKIDRYTTLEARGGRSRYGVWQPLHLLVTGPAVFWREYVWRGGWRDGREGALWAALSAWSATLRSWKVLRRVR